MGENCPVVQNANISINARQINHLSAATLNMNRGNDVAIPLQSDNRSNAHFTSGASSSRGWRRGFRGAVDDVRLCH
jgi:hypothetical protein